MQFYKAAYRTFNVPAVRIAVSFLLCGTVGFPSLAESQTIGHIYTVAGTGAAGFSGDGGPAASAQLHFPEDLVMGVNDVMYITDSFNHRIRKVQGGLISTVAGSGSEGYSGDTQSAVGAQISQPEGVAIDALGHLYIADYGNHRIRRVTAGGRITTLAGGEKGDVGDGFPARGAAFRSPLGVTVDSSGQLYILDSENYRVRKIQQNGIITTLAGNGTQGYSGDGGDAVHAQLGYPTDVEVDALGNVYIADSQNHVVRKVDTQGRISTFAGTGVAGYSGDGGLAVNGQFDTPTDLAVDTEGRLFIADSFNHAVRKVDTNGVLSTLAGSGEAGYEGDGGPASAAKLNVPLGVELDREGSLYIADNENHSIRRVYGASTPGMVPGVFLPSSGDVNRDGSVDVIDGVRVLRFLVGFGVLTEEEVLIADTDGDAVPTVSDVVLILREAVGLP